MAASWIHLTFDPETFEHHVGGIDGLHFHGTAFGTDVGQMVAVKLVAADAQQQWFHFVQFQSRILDDGTALLDDVEAKLDMVGTVARECVETNLHPFDVFGFLRSGLFFHRIDDGADKGNFVHNMIWF
jgi:hypothetical protein